jgi:hypothetical protein
VQLLRSYNLLMARLYRLFGKNYEPKRRSTWAYSERRHTATSVIMADDVMRTSASFPSNTGAYEKEQHPRKSRPSLVIGSVSDILVRQDSARSPGTRFPRKSSSFPRTSLRNDDLASNHFVANSAHFTHSARQRKVSAVSEEAQPEDATVQEEKAVTSRPKSKAHDSDEEVQGSNLGHIDALQNSPFQDTGVDTFSAPAGQNLGQSEHTSDTHAQNRSTASDAETYA